MTRQFHGLAIVSAAGLIDYIWVHSGLLFFLAFLAMYLWNYSEDRT